MNRRLFTVLFQGIASGLPLALVGSTLQAWFAVSKVDITTIGILTLVGQPYAYKFLWSPFLDRYVPPFLGRRRGWIILTQLLLVLALIATLFFRPTTSGATLACLALLIAFFSASQDIAIDAYRTEILVTNELGIGSALYTFGYRLAMLISGGGALILADYFGWHTMYLIMAGIMLMEIGVTLCSPEESIGNPPPTLREAIIEPLRDFFKREQIISIIIFIVLYKLTDALATSLSSKFLLDLGFSLSEIGTIYKGIGFFATLLGTFIGGFLMLRINLYRALFWFGILQAISNLLFAWLAINGKNLHYFMLAVFGENFCGGLGTIALMAFLMSLCNKRFTATQFALLSSIASLGRIYVGPFAGMLAKHYAVTIVPSNWAIFYFWSFAIALPSLILLVWLSRNSVEVRT